ncbi:MAG: type I methionyl aminopeptidase [Clostridiales Family XIII bacterium]|jgi:methionyl aminopeptidase|nr:type I methionyl aminopeptidase [Clostridiales Family XIII bacterium]
MIYLKTDDEIDMMRTAGKVVGSILYELADVITPGVSTAEVNDFVDKKIRAEGMEPTFLGYNGFPASACISVNEEIVHGIPSPERLINEGDIVGVDIGATYGGWVADAARTYTAGDVSEKAASIVSACKDSFFAGLAYCRIGCRLGDIGHAIQETAEARGFSVVRDLVGHGVGRQMHEDPQVKNYGAAGKGVKLMKGMALAIEPMINEGVYDTRTLEDNWTVVTEDGGLSAHYENTVIITDGAPELITLDDREAAADK